MQTISVNWSGNYPTKCSGKWSIYVNEIDMSDKIPPCLIDTHMNTFGTYTLCIDDNISNKISYEDGLTEREWINENYFWLHNITSDQKILSTIFKEFQKHDWRPCECGGCV